MFNSSLFQNKAFVVALLIWTFVWKGKALWKAARRDEKWWFIAILIINTFGLLELFYIYGWEKLKNKQASAITAPSHSKSSAKTRRGK